ncbi:FadR/GntR family transcriptional regulator [Kineococcus radiotolerans]|uniref:FadR/GntR family transcriptional regulator n=1 Tax=Kineococcus radiotolerans TaxID=131568 RepID=UPI00003A485A|nr:FCD domain-containing protein [Kineococcus radiotolerans]
MPDPTPQPRADSPRDGGPYDRVLERLGRRVVDGELPPGTVLALEGIAAEHGVSRTVAREVVRVLESLNLLVSRRRVGVVVRPREQWTVLDPRIVRWRLAGPGRQAQLLALSELRLAVEPVAAALAARHATPEQCGALVEAVVGMTVTARTPDLTAYLQHDARFHRTLLGATANDAFAALAGTLTEVLAGRTEHRLMPARPAAQAIAWHREVAEAVSVGDADAAEDAMRSIVREATAAMAAASAPGA